MVLTLFGIVTLLIAAVLAMRSITTFFVFTLFASLFSGSAAIYLTALGGSTVTPGSLAFVLLVCRVLCSRVGQPQRLLWGAGRNADFTAFCLYGLASAFILPWIFDGTFEVFPLKPMPRGEMVPLHFSNQNITTAGYLILALLGAPLGAAISRWEHKANPIINAIIILAWSYVFFGLADEFLSLAGHGDLLNFFRNGHYAQLNQRVNGLKRLAGTFPEASTFAGYGFGWFAFLTEFWLRNIKPRATGSAAVAVLLIVLLSTSSTGYVSLLIYGTSLALRLSIFPSRLPQPKVMVLWCALAAVFLGSMLLVLTNKEVWQDIVGIFRTMTLNKLQSSSGVERMKWVNRGLDMFVKSYGLGVGMGSFRSSSMLIAIIGSVGVPGTYLFLSYIWKVLRPDRRASYNLRQAGDEAIASAFAWAAVAALIPAVLSGSSPDPGANFAFFCAYALAMRRLTRERRTTLGELQTGLPASSRSAGPRPRPGHHV